MLVLWLIFAGIFLLAEVTYHFSGYGPVLFNPLYALALICAWSGVCTFLVSIVKGIAKKILYFVLTSLFAVWYCAQIVYLHIFKQPLLWEATFTGGGDALTNYYKEALLGIWQCLPLILLVFAPIIATAVLMVLKKWKLPQFTGLQALRLGVITVVGLVVAIVTMQVGRVLETDYYEEYTEFYDPIWVAENQGALPLLQRDTVLYIGSFFEDMELFAGEDDEPYMPYVPSVENTVESDAAQESTEEVQEPEEVVPVYVPQQFEINTEVLASLADGKKTKWLAEYFQTEPATYTNEYTGIFEGYNLIFLTAEGFCTYAIREDLTPTLYRLANSGFVFNNYYVPLWQTSTSDGEYINTTGLIPDGQFSMRKSGANNMAFSLPRYFAKEGVNSLAYHNNSLSYYDRHVTHPNLGYVFKAAKSGKLSETEYADWLFEMEHPGYWPQSDLEMVYSTAPEYLGLERFNVYYMTISGHMNYNFGGNRMSRKNKDAVTHLEMSENAQAYIACHIELDKALEDLLYQLEQSGQLDKTVICLSADHYPYAMTEEEYDELAGRSLATGQEKFRNTLILWNAGMEEEPVYVDKACGSMDLVPTLLNLFGFEFDSRLYAGRDIFSDREGMVIFNDRSFVTDSVSYSKKTKETIWFTDEDGNYLVPEEQQEAYLEAMQAEVKRRYNFSAYILQEDYYADILQALPEGFMDAAELEPMAPKWERPVPEVIEPTDSIPANGEVADEAGSAVESGEGATESVETVN
ncbi:MAG: sulfatase-like hydrolase/transferase [Lachnospiraceae bacterium]|nr:sulfatase-like hydrolase/transferase [Lachnospiraceae bacterium]